MLDVLTKMQKRRQKFWISQRFCAQIVSQRRKLSRFSVNCFQNNAKNSHKNAGEKAEMLDFLHDCRTVRLTPIDVRLNVCDISFPEHPVDSHSVTCWTARILPRCARR